MKFLLAMICFVISSFCLASSERVILEGEFRPLTQSISIKGSGVIFEGESGAHYVAIENFNLRGGVVLDLKVCGEILPQQVACLSIGEPRFKKQLWKLPNVFLSYSQIKIFDLDLIQDLAEVR
jgi:hypothetical protein